MEPMQIRILLTTQQIFTVTIIVLFSFLKKLALDHFKTVKYCDTVSTSNGISQLQMWNNGTTMAMEYYCKKKGVA